MKRILIIEAALVVLLIILGLYLAEMLGGVMPSNGQHSNSAASEACIKLCMGELNNSTDLSNGPCLSNEIAPDWVCDVTHDPRQDVDNNPANQCSGYGKSAHHFVEVSPGCAFIREV